MASNKLKKSSKGEYLGTGIKDLENLELSSLDEKGDVVKERLGDVNAAISLYLKLRKDDRERSKNRAKFDAMFDGEAPYKQRELDNTGQQDKTNLNFGEGQRQLDIALSAYVDLYTSVEKLVEVKADSGEIENKTEKEDIVSEELSNMFREYPSFHPTFLRLATTFNKHGICPTYFDNPTDWMYQTGSFDDFLIPSETIASEECIDVVVIRREYLLHELIKFIRSEKAAEKIGWDVEETKRVIVKNTNTMPALSQSPTDRGYEAIQAAVKNGDLSFGHTNPKVSILHFLVKEMDGTISHYMCAESLPKKYMFKSLSKYSTSSEAYTIFALGVGTNGTYHSIRGLGKRIFAHIQTSNRLRCQMIDGAILSSSIMIQPENERALEELEFTYYGAYSVLSPNVNIIEKAIPDLSRSVQPALSDLQQQLEANTDTVSTFGQNGSSPYRNETQVISDIDVATRISGSAMNLFYNSWNRLLKEMVRRVFLKSSDSKPEVKEFKERCIERGVDKEFFSKLNLKRTRCAHAVGGGSAANRVVSLREIQNSQGAFDEVGRKNLARDIVAARSSYELADRYIPRVEGERPTVDDKIVFFENQQLQQGVEIPVIASELHGKHITAHAQPLNELVQAVQEGQADPVEVLKVLEVYHSHLAQHIEFGSGDEGLQGIIGQAKQLLNYVEEAVHNAQKQAEKMQREAEEQAQAEAEAQAQAQDQGGMEGMGQPIDPKMEAHQLNMQITREKADLEYEIKERKFQQEQAIRDGKAAIDLQGTNEGI